MQTVEEALSRLSRSAFRARFHLNESERREVKRRGMETIRLHAEDFIKKRLAPAVIPNDGHQTPMRGHPVFVAQHACACCCRKCLKKWYRVPQGIALNSVQQQKIVNLLIAWIEHEMRES